MTKVRKEDVLKKSILWMEPKYQVNRTTLKVFFPAALRAQSVEKKGPTLVWCWVFIGGSKMTNIGIGITTKRIFSSEIGGQMPLWWGSFLMQWISCPPRLKIVDFFTQQRWQDLYPTEVRSLPCPVSDLSQSLLLLRLYWCDPGVWRSGNLSKVMLTLR